MTDHELAIWQFVSSALGTIATVVLAIVAISVSGDWKDSLRHQRFDDCISKAHLCRGIVGRTISWKQNSSPDVFVALDQAWTSWREFRSSYVVAARYMRSLPGDFIGRSEQVLLSLGRFCAQTGLVSLTDASQINGQMNEIVQSVEKEMAVW